MEDTDTLDKILNIAKDIAPDDAGSVFFYIAIIMFCQAGKYCFAKYYQYKENIERDRQLDEQIKMFLPIIAKAAEHQDLTGVEHLREIIDSLLQEKKPPLHSINRDKDTERRKLLNQLVNDKILPLLKDRRGDVPPK